MDMVYQVRSAMLDRRPNDQEYTVNKNYTAICWFIFIKTGHAISLIGKGGSIWEELREG